MTSSEIPVRTRKRPEERREEILEHATAIALDEGLERITLRAVADRLGVRPGLITHYFPAAEALVIEAFTRAAVRERERFFTTSGTPMDRVAHFAAHIERGASLPLARMWLNARHLARFSPALDTALQHQDQLDRERLTAIIEDGIASSVFPITDAETACIRILMAVDGGGSYVNTATPPTHRAHRQVVADVSEWALGLEPGALRAAVDAASEA
ncbi:TetR/AcrR family transcriptional regulator [Microbacterium sp. LWH3-1.2]|uniref:TetR/AcrR family transcriptional regulator n=1 Tax=Microbacterium sp. LWH3-1.2 TaxID=3135256 RepID=UPI00344210D1